MKHHVVHLTVLLLSPIVGISSTWALAAAGKKRSGKKQQPSAATAASNKGFGTAPPTYEETLASFTTRLPSDADDQPCPCQSGDLYKDCCKVYHIGQEWPSTPLSVLRSRYSAFCFRNIQYIIESTHSTCRDYQHDRIAWAKSLDKNGMFDSYTFQRLNVIKEEETTTNDDDDNDNEEKEAFIDFQVQLRSNASGQETTVAEKSRFLKENGRWKYASGDVRSTIAGVDDIVLNQ